MKSIRRFIVCGSIVACVLLVAVAAIAISNSGSEPEITIITEAQTPLAAFPGSGGVASGNAIAFADEGDDVGKMALTAPAPDSDDSVEPTNVVEILDTDRSKEVVVPVGTTPSPDLVWHEPYEETVWVPVTYWKKTHHVEVYGTREVIGSVCFDGTPLPSDLTPEQTVDFVAEHGGGYKTGVASYEVYLLRPAYVERELVQGGTYQKVQHEGYWAYE